MSQKPDFSRFKAVERKAVRLSDQDLVKLGRLNERAFPLLIEPSLPGVNLNAWAEGHRGEVDAKLGEHGAILFRGFAVGGVTGFESFVNASCGAALRYSERSSPRSQVEGNVYTSTDHPASQTIFLHNEQSYSLTFPLRIIFHCVTAPEEGGATPIADVRRVYQRLRPELRQRFAELGYLYVRNFGDGFGLSWQTAFQTEDQAVVEDYCRANEIAWEWKSEGRLRTRQLRRALGRHPGTGEPVWFNHLTFFHVSTLEEPVRSSLLNEFAAEDLPNNTFYGDGSAIEPEVLEELRAAYHAETVSFPWQEGDILMMDNMLAAHGRAPFKGPRKIVVAMSNPFPWSEVAAV